MHSGSSGNDSQGRLYHKPGSPPSTQPHQQSTQKSADLSQGPSPHTSGYAAPQPHLQQYMINPVTGVQSAIVSSGRPVPLSPVRVPIQHGQGSPPGIILQQQQQQQQLSPHDVARQQALMQLAGFQSQLVAASSSQVVNLQLSPSYVDPSTGIPVHRMSVNTPPSSIGAASHPYVFQDTPKLYPQGEELQISPEQIHMQSLLLPSHHQPVGTIHHHGQGSPRSTMPPLGFGAARRISGHSPTRSGPPADRKSPVAAAGGSGATAYHRSLSSPARTNPIPSSTSRMRKSPLMASETDRPPATHEVAELRTRLLEHKLSDLHDLQDSYKEKLAELFFLENGYNMMDYLAWKKRPSTTLHSYMTSRKLEEGHEEEITINDEVKVITNSGSNIPLGTPVAISKQLPPAVSALSSQIKAKELRKSFPGALPTASPDLDRKRTYSQAGLDSSGTSERKPLGFPSTHEPNVTLSPKTVTPIPALPGSQPSVLFKQQQHKQQHGIGQQQHQQLHGSSSRSQGAAAAAAGTSGAASHSRTSLNVLQVRREPKSPPAAKHSLHQLKLPTSRPLTINTSSVADVTSTPTTVPSASPRRHSGTTPVVMAQPPAKLPKSPISPNAHQRLATRQHSLSAVYDYTIGSQEMIVERAKQEAQVMQRIAELRKEGLWSARRLPKVQEPPRHKTHWDYLLEEAQWLATDFVQERRWKKAAARKLVRAVARFHQERHAKEVKAEREETQKLRRIASNIAKEIKTFWSNIEKVVQYKQQSRLDERRRKAMDMQLDYIVGQTEKYSSWLTEGLNLNATGSSAQGSLASSPRSDPEAAATADDVDFQPDDDDTDDEETIDVEEREAEQDQDAHQKELELLQRESEVPLEDLIGSLPPEMIGEGEDGKEGEVGSDGPSTGEKAKENSEITKKDGEATQEEPGLSEVTKEAEENTDKAATADEEFVPSTDDEEEEMPDDEETLDEQEEAEGAQDHVAEVAELEAEGELSMEELLKKYGGAYDEDFQMPVSDDDDDGDDEDEAEEDEETEEEEEEDDDMASDEEEAELTDVGMEYLINPDKENEEPSPAVPASTEQAQDSGPNKEITDIAAAAQSLQPTGYTLSTTQVKTPVPFLLRHKLREYQHIGLDWLVTMNDKRLNGILADEMGLGKTIQTIALLAHLACETGNWGPHLIVVPTSVMLNWEMEFKKWCPGFKILTYFGSQKERKQKRQGWTKSNAFHVCITSYKLVIQDHQSFRRKKWKYLVLDEAQNIKNFKSQRWQTLLNFNSQRRLLLTGTPLQNNLMELWSLMHFLMPHVFASHREFREWFSNPLSGMIEGTQEYNEGLIRRLHKVLRPFLLRRLKSEVERQLPQKYEHLVRCRLSRRQRFLYDDFMSQAKTRETLSSGHFMSVINVLMQLRKVCNHPDLFEARPIQSSFQMEGILFYTASLITKAMEYDPHKRVSLSALNMCIANLELSLPAYAAHRIKQLQTPRPLIEEIDSAPEPPPRPQPMKIKPGKLFPLPTAAAVSAAATPATPVTAATSQAQKEAKVAGGTGTGTGATTTATTSALTPGRASPSVVAAQGSAVVAGGRSSPSVSHMLVRSSTGIQMLRQTGSTQQGVVLDGRSSPSVSLALTTSTSSSGVPSLTLVSHPAVPSSTPLQQLPGYTGVVVSSTGGSGGQQRFYLQPQTTGAGRGQFVTTQPITVQLQGASGGQGTTIRLPASQIRQMSQGGIVQIVQTASGHQVLGKAVRLTSPATSQQQANNQSRSSPVPIQMTLQASSPQIPRSFLQQGTATSSSTASSSSSSITTTITSSSPATQSQAQTVIQALAQAVTQASSSGQAGSAGQSQQLQSVLAQFQRQQLQQRQQQQQQQTLQQLAPAAQTETKSSSSTISLPLTQLIRTTSSQQGSTKPIASVAPMVNATVTTTTAVEPVVKTTAMQPTSLAGTTRQPTDKKSDGVIKVITEGRAQTATAPPCTTLTSPPPLVAIRPTVPTLPGPLPALGDRVGPGCASTTTSADPVMQPVLKIRPLTSQSIARATGGPKVSVTTSGSRPAVTVAAQKSKSLKKHKTDSPFFLESMHQAEIEERSATLARLADLNQIRCAAKPVYGSDLRSVVSILNAARPAGEQRPYESSTGLFHCQGRHGLPFPQRVEARLSQTHALQSIVKTPEDILEELKDIIKRFVMVVPMATSPPIAMHTSHPAPSAFRQEKLYRETLQRTLKPTMACMHPIQNGMRLQFPELRLIQYDCGKLQALDVLLRKLKAGDHRVLIFTQMTRMLDVLEVFLNYHGHIYVRLDGTTRVEQRQFLMDRFNMDKRIFCFILSTRSGGLGINLTGADTVIFYDSDWNPTMDAQAQDRCHRIGQTRDVHIYRLISEMTVEENILKKANQKRLLVDVSIEGGNFTTAFFKTNTIKDLFDMSNRRDAKPVAIEDLLVNTRPDQTPGKPQAAGEEKEAITQNQLEQALAKTEDETDVKATSKALAEQDAELAEFDETIPYEGEESKAKEEVSKIEIELAQLDNQLTNIEKYAMRYLEANMEPPPMDEVLEAEEQVLLAKKEWELERLQALKEEEERKAEQEEDEIFFTYCDEEAKNKVHKSRSKSRRTQGAGSKPGSEKSSRANSRSSSVERNKRSSSQATPGRSTRRNPKADPTPDDSGPRSPVTRSGAAKSPPPVPPAPAVLSPRSPLARLAPAKPAAKKSPPGRAPAEKLDVAKSKSSSKERPKSDTPKEPKAKKSRSGKSQQADVASSTSNSPIDLSVSGLGATVAMDLSMQARQSSSAQEVTRIRPPASVVHELLTHSTVPSSYGNNLNMQPLNLSPRSKQPQQPSSSGIHPMPGLVSRLTTDSSAPLHPSSSTLSSVPLLMARHPITTVYSPPRTLPAESSTNRPASQPKPAAAISLESVLQGSLAVPFSSSTGVQSINSSQLLSLNMPRGNLTSLQLVQQDASRIHPRFGLPNQTQVLCNPPPLQSIPMQRHPQTQQQAVVLQPQYQLQAQLQQAQVAPRAQTAVSQAQFLSREQLLKLQSEGRALPLPHSSPQKQSQQSQQSQIPILARLQMLSQPGGVPHSQASSLHPTLHLSLARHPAPTSITQSQAVVHQQILSTSQVRGTALPQSQPRQQGQPILARIEVMPANQYPMQNRFSSQLLSRLQGVDPRLPQVRPKMPLPRQPHHARLQTPMINPQVLLHLQQRRTQNMSQSVVPPRDSLQSSVLAVHQSPSQPPAVSPADPQLLSNTSKPQSTVLSSPESQAKTPPQTVLQMLSERQTMASRLPQTLDTTVQPQFTVKQTPSPTKAPPPAVKESSSGQPDIKAVSRAPEKQSSGADTQSTEVTSPPNLVGLQVSTHSETGNFHQSPPQLTPQLRTDLEHTPSGVQTDSLHHSGGSMDSQLQTETQISPPVLTASEEKSNVEPSLLAQDHQSLLSTQNKPKSPPPIPEVGKSPLESERMIAEALTRLKQKVESASNATSTTTLESVQLTPGSQAPVPQMHPTPLPLPRRISPHPTHSPPSTQSSPNSQSPPQPKSPALCYSPEPLDLSPPNKSNPLNKDTGPSLVPVSKEKSETSGISERSIFDLAILRPNISSVQAEAPGRPQTTTDGVSPLPSQEPLSIDIQEGVGNSTQDLLQTPTKPKPLELSSREKSTEQRNIFQVLSSLMKSPGSNAPTLPQSPPQVISSPVTSPPPSTSPQPMPFDLTIPKSPQLLVTVADRLPGNSHTINSDHSGDSPQESITPVRKSPQNSHRDEAAAADAAAAAEATPSRQLAKAALKQKLAKMQLFNPGEHAGPRTRAKSDAELADKLIRTRSRSRHQSSSPALSLRDLKNLSRASSRSSSATNSRDASPARGGTPNSDKNPAGKRGRGRPRKYTERS